jgi:hypothetical protein
VVSYTLTPTPPARCISDIKPAVPIGERIATAVGPSWKLPSADSCSIAIWEILSPVLKRPGPEADHSPLPSADANNVWSHTSTLPCVFVAWCTGANLPLQKHINMHFCSSIQALKQSHWCEPSAATGMLDDITSTKVWGFPASRFVTWAAQAARESLTFVRQSPHICWIMRVRFSEYKLAGPSLLH